LLKIIVRKTRGGQAFVAHACNPNYSQAKIRTITVRSQPGQIVHEKTITKKAGRVA
jgi:hypothetical protein